MIFISGNVASSKNSKMKTKWGLISSPLVQKYKNNTALQWVLFKRDFLEMLEGKEKPYKIEFYFIRDSKRRFDYVNAAQLPLDLMQTHGWLEDDDSTHVIPVFKGFEVNKENAGVQINVL